ncbi:hypothetical protein ABES03_20280 [Neobacillus rhizosphaerae]
MLIELIAYTVQDALNAEVGGVNRIEFVPGIGGRFDPQLGIFRSRSSR